MPQDDEDTSGVNESLEHGEDAVVAYLNAAEVLRPRVGALDFPASLGYNVCIVIDVVSGEIPAPAKISLEKLVCRQTRYHPGHGQRFPEIGFAR